MVDPNRTANSPANFRLLQGKTAPVIQLGLLGLAAAFFARLLVIATGAGFAQRAFTIKLLLEAA